MLKVMIADDEPKVCKLINELIDWERLNLAFIGSCNDGARAYELICQAAPDIAITDIRMPILTGLDLIQKCYEDKRDIHFIVVSGYRYFEYAQKALQYGVVDYLLKPIDENALNKALEHICKLSMQQQEQQQSFSDMETRLKNNQAFAGGAFIREIMNVQVYPPEKTVINGICDKYDMEFSHQYFTAYMIRVDRKANSPRSMLQEKLILDKLLQIAKEETSASGIDSVIGLLEGLTIPILLNWDDDKNESERELSHNIMRRLREYFSVYRDYTPTLGMSSVMAQVENIQILLNEADRTICQRLLLGTNQRIKADTLPPVPQKVDKILNHCRGAYLHAVEVMNVQEIQNVIADCFQEAEKGQNEGKVYYRLCQELIALLKNNFANGDLTDATVEEWYEALFNITDETILKKTLSSEIVEYIATYRKKREEAESKPIRDVIDYIHQHYGEKILIEDMAARTFFNTTYFSELFKRQTGKNFSDYLTEVRISEAKEMLRDSRQNIGDIADKVGYKDTKYFTKIFTKLVGIKPSEYRKLYL